MLNKFRQWYLRNYTEITWFLIGFLIMAGLQSLSVHDYSSALINFGLAWVNYIFSRR